MAGDWIKVENITPDKPEVFVIAEHLGIDPDAVVGKLVRVWIWADSQTYDGNAASVTSALLDRVTGVAGFADAMRAAGWLEETDDGLRFPHFERHNGQTGKRRALTSKRVAKHRAKCNAPVTAKKRSERQSAVTREEKRREEKREEEEAGPPDDDSPWSLSPSPASEEPADDGNGQPLVFPCVGKGAHTWALTAEKLEEYRQAYPDLDVLSELRAARQWLRDNPGRLKTPKGMLSYLTRWLTKAQHSGQGRAPPTGEGDADRERRRKEQLDRVLRAREGHNATG